MKLNEKVVSLEAPAKLNLSLNIHNIRKSGYHSISSYIIFLDLKDTLKISYSKKNTVHVYGQQKSFINKDNNLILDTLNFCRKNKIINENYKIMLNKDIPVSAGLGGGSADSASLLRYFLNKSKKKFSDYKNLVSNLGSDIPACFYSKPLFADGIGERIKIINKTKTSEAGFLLVKPEFSIQTKDAFSKVNSKVFTEKNYFSNHPNLNSLSGCYEAISMGNDFNKVQNTKYDTTNLIQTKIKNLKGCLGSSLSGSGPTCFGLFKSVHDAKNAYTFCKNKSIFNNCWMVYCGVY
mgnify:FL=1